MPQHKDELSGADLGGGAWGPGPPHGHTFHNACTHLVAQYASCYTNWLQDSPANQLNAVLIWPACQCDL